MNANEEGFENEPTAQGESQAIITEPNGIVEIADAVIAPGSTDAINLPLDEEQLDSEAKRKRDPIQWNGVKNEAEPQVQAGNVSDQDPIAKRLRPNPKFLHTYLNGLERQNKRLIADAASNAACKELTAVAASGAKVQFDRIPESENEKFRKIAMKVAKQQNTACCIAVLKEVAAHYGFALFVETEDSMARANKEAETGSPVEAEISEEESEPDPRVMQPLYAGLKSDFEVEDYLDHRKRPQPAPDPDKPIAIPVLAARNRLAHSALAAITGKRMGLTKNGLKSANGHKSRSPSGVKSPTKLAMDSIPAQIQVSQNGISEEIVSEEEEEEEADDVNVGTQEASHDERSPTESASPSAAQDREEQVFNLAEDSREAKPKAVQYKSRLFSSTALEDDEEPITASLSIQAERYQFPEEGKEKSKSPKLPSPDFRNFKTKKRKPGNRLFGSAMIGLGR